MAYDKLIPLIVIPALLLGQDQLSEAAQELLSKQQFGFAQLTLSDGRNEDGRIVRVTDQFVTFVTNRKPPGCENVELSKVAAVFWHPASKRISSSELGSAVYLGAVLSPFFVIHEAADPFRRMFPPLRPPRGEWESIRPSPGGEKSSLYFDGETVKHREVTVKQGRYHVEENRLHMMFDGEPERVTQFRFNCAELILDSPPAKFYSVSAAPHRASPPIVAEWHTSSGSVLDLRPDGILEERKEEHRNGTFEMTTKGVKIHWTDSQGPGGEDWSAQIKHRHVLVRIGSVTTEYRYVPPGFATDL